MPAPTTSVLDNFDRANGALGANWGQAFSTYSMPTIVSNRMDWPQFPSAAWTASSFNANQEVFVQFTTTAVLAYMLLRFQGENSGTESGYGIYAQIVTPFSAEAVKYTSGTAPTSLGFANTIMSATDTYIWATAEGNTLKLYGGSDGVSYTLRQTWTDSTFNRTGKIGVYHPNNGTVGTLDNFGGGNMPVVPAGVANIDFTRYPRPVLRTPSGR